jgi:hypothetical protein
MAKFGRFAFGQARAQEKYEGDFMVQEGQYVKIFKRPSNANETGALSCSNQLRQGTKCSGIAGRCCK